MSSLNYFQKRCIALWGFTEPPTSKKGFTRHTVTVLLPYIVSISILIILIVLNNRVEEINLLFNENQRPNLGNLLTIIFGTITFLGLLLNFHPHFFNEDSFISNYGNLPSIGDCDDEYDGLTFRQTLCNVIKGFYYCLAIQIIVCVVCFLVVLFCK